MESFIAPEKYFDRFIKLPFVGFEGLKKLQKSKVLLVGAGGLGNPCALNLALSGVGHIDVVDHDRIEVSNLHRQSLFLFDDIGRSKSQTLLKRVKSHVPSLKGEAFSIKLTIENIQPLIKGHDVVIDATDDMMTKFILHDFCKQLEINYITASVHQGEGVMMSFEPHLERTPCLRCLYPKIPRTESRNSCSEVGVWTSIVQIFGAYMATECTKKILKMDSLKNGEQLMFDLFTMNSYHLSFEKSNTCEYCDRDRISSLNEKLLNSLKDSFLENVNPDLYQVISAFDLNLDATIRHSEHKYVIVCKTGRTAREQCLRLRSLGYENVFYSFESQ